MLTAGFSKAQRTQPVHVAQNNFPAQWEGCGEKHGGGWRGHMGGNRDEGKHWIVGFVSLCLYHNCSFLYSCYLQNLMKSSAFEDNILDAILEQNYPW